MLRQLATILFKICWYLTAAALAGATFVEQMLGKTFIHQHFYGHWAFWTALSMFVVLGTLLSFLSSQNKVVKCLHLTPLFLLVGSLVSIWLTWGKAIVFVGYAWFSVFYVLLMAKKDGEFRTLLKKLSIMVLPILLFPIEMSAQKTISREVAREMEDVVVEYEGREAPLVALCDDYLFDIYGDTKYGDFSSVEVVMGWVLFPEEWISEPIVKVSGRVTRQKLHCGKYASPLQLLGTENSSIIENIDIQEDKNLQKVVLKLRQLQYLRSGLAFKIFPTHHRWFSAADDLSSLPSEEKVFIHDFFKTLYINTFNQNSSQNIILVQQLREKQRAQIQRPRAIQSEVCYHHAGKWLSHWLPCLIVLLLLAFRHLFFSGKEARMMDLSFRILAFILLLMAIIHWIWRWTLCGHIPLSSSYDTLLFLSIIILLITNILWKKNPLLPIGGLFLLMMVFVVMGMSFNSSKISLLPPVLDSPWLSIHVLLMMVSYALLAFTFIIPIILLIIKILNKFSLEIEEKLTAFSRLLLWPGIGLLVLGIMTGSVWGDTAWGHYWNWDPKEVWALVTLMLYAPALLTRFFPRFQRPLFYHIYMIAAFLGLLMTYFGVNFWLGGLHAYA